MRKMNKSICLIGLFGASILSAQNPPICGPIPSDCTNMSSCRGAAALAKKRDYISYLSPNRVDIGYKDNVTGWTQSLVSGTDYASAWSYSPYGLIQSTSSLVGLQFLRPLALGNPVSLNPAVGFTLRIQVSTRTVPNGESSLVAMVDNSSGVLFSIGRNGLNYVFGKNQVGLSPIDTNSSYWIHPWDPVSRKDRWNWLYVTFQPDGKVRYDLLYQDISIVYDSTGDVAPWNWYSGLIENGFPRNTYPQGTATAVPGPNTYLASGNLVVGPLNGNTFGNSVQGASGFGGLAVYDSPLTPNMILADVTQATAAIPSTLPLQINMKPDNTGCHQNPTDQSQTPRGFPEGPDFPLGFTKCADKGGTCAAPAGVYLFAYGANGYHVVVTSTSSTAYCSNTGNPQINVTEGCAVSPGGSLPTQYWTKCADYGGVCSIPGDATVAYGGYIYDWNGIPHYGYATKPVRNSIPCSVNNFSIFDLSWIPQSSAGCYYSAITKVPPALPGFSFIQSSANNFTVPANGVVACGSTANNNIVWWQTFGRSGGTTFIPPWGDSPVGGYTPRTCFFAATANQQLPSTYQLCAAQGGTCSWQGNRPAYVAYSSDGGNAIIGRFLSSPVSCVQATWGMDPDPGQPKSCYVITQ